MNKKNGTKICAMMLVLVFIVQVGAGASRPSLNNMSDEVNAKNKKDKNESQVIMLDGSITANLCNGSGGVLKDLVYPTIDMPGEQALSIGTSKDNESWVVNASLRININKPELSNKSYLIPRCITIFAVVIRKNQPFISGLLRDLIIGGGGTRINVFSENSSDYAEIPLRYTTKTQDESQRVFIIAIGSLLGFISKCPPVIVTKTVDLSCHYSTAPNDVVPPFTEIILTGNEVYENLFKGKVQVSFLSNDVDSSVQDTLFRYLVNDPDGVSNQSQWLSYHEPMMFNETGSYAINYYSTDTAGNIEDIKTKAFEIRM